MRREYVGLAALLVAIAIALPYVLFNGAGDPGDPLPQATEVPTYTPTVPPPTPTITPTPVPDRGQLSAPASWALTMYRMIGGTPRDEDPVIVENLDFSFPTPPFADYREGQWGMKAGANWQDLPAGRYLLRLEYDCVLAVHINGEEVASKEDPPGTRTLEVAYVHAGGALELVIEARDAPGPFVLRWP